jgi:hypothetical protein
MLHILLYVISVFLLNYFRIFNTFFRIFNAFFCIFNTFSVFLIQYLITNIWPMTSEHGGKADRGSLSESMYTACSTQLTAGLACTLSITREYMEYGGRLPANCALTVYYLPVYPPYSDYNYGLRGHLLVSGH